VDKIPHSLRCNIDKLHLGKFHNPQDNLLPFPLNHRLHFERYKNSRWGNLLKFHQAHRYRFGKYNDSLEDTSNNFPHHKYRFEPHIVRK